MCKKGKPCTDRCTYLDLRSKAYISVCVCVFFQIPNQTMIDTQLTS